MEYVLEMKDISKTFPGVKALDHVQLQVKPGEVHALMGENGAGKSTLMKILMGIYTKDNGGEIIFNGQPYHVSNPKEAMDHGVAMIHQELNPILDMSVYENIFVGREIRKNGLVDAKAEIAEAEKLIKECGIYCIECLGTIDSQYPDCAFLFIQQHNEYHPFRIILYLAILILLCSPVIVKLGKAKIKEHSVFLSHCTH